MHDPPAAHAILWAKYAVASTLDSKAFQMTRIRFMRPLLCAMPPTTDLVTQPVGSHVLSTSALDDIADFSRACMPAVEGYREQQRHFELPGRRLADFIDYCGITWVRLGGQL